jgi:hypothetical protein
VRPNKNKSRNRQIHILGFHCVAKILERWLKIYIFLCSVSQIWLNPLRGWLPLWLQTKTPFKKTKSVERENPASSPVLEIIAGSKKQQVPALLSHLLGTVTSAVVRPPVARKTRDDAMDEEGERASWLLLLSRAFARCFVRASDAKRARQKRLQSGLRKNIKALAQPRWMHDVASSQSPIAVELILLQWWWWNGMSTLTWLDTIGRIQ